MPKIYLDSVSESTTEIGGESARYLISVLRSRAGDEIAVFDGRGNCFRAEITAIGKKQVSVKIMEKFYCDTESMLDIVLLQGILKSEKMDFVIQKTTELGVGGIAPVVTERTQVRDTRKVKRWNKIALEASRQSGRSVSPVVHEPLMFEDALKKFRPGLIFWEEGGINIGRALETFGGKPALTIAVGPEGGFIKQEIGLAERSGFVVSSLGRRILRAETAAIAALAVVQYLSGDMSPGRQV